MENQSKNMAPARMRRMAILIAFSCVIPGAHASKQPAQDSGSESKTPALSRQPSIKSLKEYALHPDRATLDNLTRDAGARYSNLDCMDVESRKQCRYMLQGASSSSIKLYSMQITTSSSGAVLGAYLTWTIDRNVCLYEKDLGDFLRVTPRTGLPPTYLSFDDDGKDAHQRSAPVLARPLVYADPNELGKGVVTAFSSEQCVRRIELTTYQ